VRLSALAEGFVDFSPELLCQYASVFLKYRIFAHKSKYRGVILFCGVLRLFNKIWLNTKGQGNNDITSSPCQLPPRWFLARLIFDPEDGCDVPPKSRLIFNELHGIISKKIALLKEYVIITLN
jgi:hypothetical protein